MDLAKKFYFAWCDKVNARKKELENTWRNSKAYTKTIIHSNSSILMDISETLGFKCYNADYYFIDAVFFKPEDLVPEYPEAYYLTDLRIAFEHENDFASGLFQEVCHLLQVNCDLKVLVTYPPNETDELSELKYLYKIVRKSRKESALSENNSFLIIMGHDELAKWKGWIYKSTGWEQIANNSSQCSEPPKFGIGC